MYNLCHLLEHVLVWCILKVKLVQLNPQLRKTNNSFKSLQLVLLIKNDPSKLGGENILHFQFLFCDASESFVLLPKLLDQSLLFVYLLLKAFNVLLLDLIHLLVSCYVLLRLFRSRWFNIIDSVFKNLLEAFQLMILMSKLFLKSLDSLYESFNEPVFKNLVSCV
jgi:hypothetical protein